MTTQEHVKIDDLKEQIEELAQKVKKETWWEKWGRIVSVVSGTVVLTGLLLAYVVKGDDLIDDVKSGKEQLKEVRDDVDSLKVKRQLQEQHNQNIQKQLDRIEEKLELWFEGKKQN